MDLFKSPPRKSLRDDFEPIPVAEAQETDWADWEDSVASQAQAPGDFQSTDKMPLAPADTDSLDAYSSVTKNRS